MGGERNLKEYVISNAKQLLSPYSSDPRFPLDEAITSHLERLAHSSHIELPAVSGGALVEESAFDSGVLGVKVFRLTEFYPVATDIDGLSDLVRAVNEAASKLSCDLLIARVNAQNMALAQALERSDYVMCDVLSTYSLIARQLIPFQTSGLTLREGTTDDANWMIDISTGQFSMSHYFNSPWIKRESANKIMEAWIKNSVAGYADGVLVAERGDERVGYATWRRKVFGQDYLVWLIDLVAVSKAHQGRGIGRTLVSRATADARANGAMVVYAGTQANNIAACKMYESLGLRQASLSVTFHRLLSK